jgi:hypothetical protein
VGPRTDLDDMETATRPVGRPARSQSLCLLHNIKESLININCESFAHFPVQTVPKFRLLNRGYGSINVHVISPFVM